MFVASCLHGVCYKNHDMIQPKRRKDLAKVLIERISKKVLTKLHILYDFNCQAKEYLYNRFSDLFVFNKFLIDR